MSSRARLNFGGTRASARRLAAVALLFASAACSDSGSGACADETLTYTSVGKPFVDTYCVSCHGGALTGSARQGAPPAYVFDTLAQIKMHAPDIHEDVVVKKVMPFGTSSLKPSQEEREQFGKWLDCDAPE